MKKLVNFIIPYFGSFPNYFQLFLNSCKFNKDFNWTIITDNKQTYNYPENVSVVYTTLKETRKKIEEKLGFNVALEKPYKFCDLKPSFGYLFSEYLEGYMFWGYCDVDLILGDLSSFITSDLLSEYDKLFTLGHMTLIKNTQECNELFMSRINGEEYYKKVFTSELSFNFDEIFRDKININDIFLEHGKKIYTKSNYADIYTKSSNFLLDCDTKAEKKVSNFFVWHNGKIIRKYYENKTIKTSEYIYIHLQKRPMVMKKGVENSEIIKIIPNSFEPLEIDYSEIDKNFWKIKKKHINAQYFRIRYNNLKKKIHMYFRKDK